VSSYNRDTRPELHEANTLSQASAVPSQIRLRLFLRILMRAGAVVVATVLALGIIAPFINAERFSNPIRRALEAWLGRRVQFQAVHFTVFSGPGFSLQNVLIQEAPAYGLEPFAYVPALDARIRWDQLLLGRIRFSSLRLEAPYINLVKQPGGSWNVLDLMHRLSARGDSHSGLFPALEVSDGRIDFRFGTRKTTLYISDADLSLSPDRGGDLSLDFSGSPARTDRAGMGFGHLRGNIHWYAHPRANGDQIDGSLTLDPSNLSELTTLFAGHDVGIHGDIAGHARIGGALDAVRVNGDLHVDDVHRWDLFPSEGEGWRILYAGILDMNTHSIELHTAPQSPVQSAVTLSLRATGLLGRPDWSIGAKLNQVALGSALPLARRLGLPLPDSLAATGTLEGSAGYSASTGLSGLFVMRDVTASVAGEPRFETSIASATLAADHLHLDPATVQGPGGGTLEASGDYYFSNGRLVASLDARRFSAAELRRTLANWFGSPDALAAITAGQLSGHLDYEHQSPAPPAWSGSFDIAGATMRLAPLSGPLTDCRGSFSFDANTFSLPHLSARLGNLSIAATYRFNANARRREQLRLTIPEAGLDGIQAALAPVLQPGGLFARLGFTHRRPPAWLKERDLDAEISIPHFSAHNISLGSLRAHLLWRGTAIGFSSLHLLLPHGTLRGSGSAAIAGDAPHYRFRLAVSGVPWKKGLLAADVNVATSGFGDDLLSQLRASGTFSISAPVLVPDLSFDLVEGAFTLSLDGLRPTLQATNVVAVTPSGTWTGSAAAGPDGKLIFDFDNGADRRQIVSTLDANTPDSPQPGEAAVQ
jgi:hypothetical protein